MSYLTPKWVSKFRDPKTDEVVTVEFSAAWEEIQMVLAARAMYAKTGKAQVLNGDLKAKVVKREPPKE